MRAWWIPLALLGCAVLAGCEGRLGTDRPRVDFDAATSDGGSRVDALALDVPSLPRVDAPASLPDVPPARPDAPPGTCPYTDPLPLPITPCTPEPLPTTGDPHEDCVRRINQFRCECQHLPPLLRWTEGEACADSMAEYDSTRSPHSGFRDGICGGGYGQNECPGWPGIASTVSGCLQQMWDEGPGDFYGPPPHGHYINMSSTSFSRVACGFYEGSSGTWAVQNFQ